MRNYQKLIILDKNWVIFDVLFRFISFRPHKTHFENVDNSEFLIWISQKLLFRVDANSQLWSDEKNTNILTTKMFSLNKNLLTPTQSNSSLTTLVHINSNFVEIKLVNLNCCLREICLIECDKNTKKNPSKHSLVSIKLCRKYVCQFKNGGIEVNKLDLKIFLCINV